MEGKKCSKKEDTLKNMLEATEMGFLSSFFEC